METKKTFEDYKNEVIKMYEKHYLEPSLGNGSVKDNLLEGLVKSFDETSIPILRDKSENKYYVPKRIENLNDIPSRPKAQLNPLLNVLETEKGNKSIGEILEELDERYENGFFPNEANSYLSNYGLKSSNGTYFYMLYTSGILDKGGDKYTPWHYGKIEKEKTSPDRGYTLDKMSREYKEYLKTKSQDNLPDPLYMFDKELPKIESYDSKLDEKELIEYMGRQNIINVLKNADIETYHDIKEFGISDLTKLRGYGGDMHRKFMSYLEEKGFSF